MNLKTILELEFQGTGTNYGVLKFASPIKAELIQGYNLTIKFYLNPLVRVEEDPLIEYSNCKAKYSDNFTYMLN